MLFLINYINLNSQNVFYSISIVAEPLILRGDKTLIIQINFVLQDILMNYLHVCNYNLIDFFMININNDIYI